MNGYDNGHAVKYIQCQCSTAHTFGNVTAYVQNWLMNLFPENLFKTIHVNSKIAHAQLRSTPNEFLKKQRPMFILRPRIVWDDNSRFLSNTPVMERQGDLYSTYAGTNLQEFFIDNKNEIAVKYQMNRHVITFDVILGFSTLMQQINWSNYFLNAVRQEIPFNLETCLESYISPELLKVVSDVSGIPLKDEDGSTRRFLEYMNGHSIYPITYKLQGSTGTEEFYRYYPAKIDTIITDFATDEGEKIGHVMSNYQVSFSIRCEFNSTGFYYIFSDRLKRMTNISVDDSSAIIPIYTDVLQKEDYDLKQGWVIYTQPSCKLEIPDDVVDISEILNSSTKETIKYHVKNGIPLVEFIEIKLRKQGKPMTLGVDYDIDIENMKIYFHKGSLYHTYKIIVLLNVGYINDLVKKVYNLK